MDDLWFSLGSRCREAVQLILQRWQYHANSSLSVDVTVDDITGDTAAHSNVVNAAVLESSGRNQALVLFEKDEQSTEALVCKQASLFSGAQPFDLLSQSLRQCSEGLFWE